VTFAVTHGILVRRAARPRAAGAETRMKSAITKKRAMLALAVLAVAGGLVVALATSGSSDHNRHATARHAAARGASSAGREAGSDTPASSGGGSNADVAPTPPRTVVAARYLGLSVPKLRAKLKQGKSLGALADSIPGHSATGLIDALVAARTARIDALKLPAATKRSRIARYRERVTQQVQRVRGSISIERDLLAASRYLGVTDNSLHDQLEGGQTIAGVAAHTKGKSIDGVIAAIVKSREARLRAEVDEHLLDAAQAKTLSAQLPEKMAAEAARKLLQSR
jgi:hypothetical protein